MAENEKQFESNIEAFLVSSAGGYEKATDAGYASSLGMASVSYTHLTADRYISIFDWKNHC